jgi:hypothetical protein
MNLVRRWCMSQRKPLVNVWRPLQLAQLKFDGPVSTTHQSRLHLHPLRRPLRQVQFSWLQNRSFLT